MLVCPHSTIRAKVVKQEDLANAPAGFKTMPAKWRELPDYRYTIKSRWKIARLPAVRRGLSRERQEQRLAAKRSTWRHSLPLRDNERVNWDYFLTLPEVNRNNGLTFRSVKDVQLLQPLFEFLGACSGCGETPYIKLLTQLFGDRAIIANATGCSSIYGGNLPTTPYTTNPQGAARMEQFTLRRQR
jgi:pyruvate-ferredoxin/flavodoxin oxidoreductase